MQNIQNLAYYATSEPCQQTWTFSDYSNGTCHCGSDIHGTVRCNSHPDQIAIAMCTCMTFDDINSIVVGQCPYGCRNGNKGNKYHSLPTNFSKINKAMCGRLNRDSRLCHKCQEGFSPCTCLLLRPELYQMY